MVRPICCLLLLLLAGCATHPATSPAKPLRGAALDQRVEQLMKAANVPGLAIAIIEDGKVVSVRAYGERDTGKRLPLQTDTVMYAASITKMAFAYAVMAWSTSTGSTSRRASRATCKSPCPPMKNMPT